MKRYMIAVLVALGLLACTMNLEIENKDGGTLDLELGVDDAEEG